MNVGEASPNLTAFFRACSAFSNDLVADKPFQAKDSPPDESARRNTAFSAAASGYRLSVYPAYPNPYQESKLASLIAPARPKQICSFCELLFVDPYGAQALKGHEVRWEDLQRLLEADNTLRDSLATQVIDRAFVEGFRLLRHLLGEYHGISKGFRTCTLISRR